LILFPNCKINLGLHIVNKRPDGYHDLETVFFPLPLFDALEVVTDAGADTTAGLLFTCSGNPIDAPVESISCVKAFHLLQKQFPRLSSLHMHLHKAIPSGAGLGGGSADGAFALKLLNRQAALGLSDTELAALALELGSDCPFFIYNRPCFATGRGEKLAPLSLDLSAYRVAVVNPGIHISTAWAFSRISPRPAPVDLREVVKLPPTEWKDLMTNDFEAPVEAAHSAITEIKQALYGAGALYAAMSGSGSTVFGLFKKEEAPALAFPSHYFYKLV
jgi:4-diphosphocytidyl-2-C-methyl-D-erythritol kinase